MEMIDADKLNIVMIGYYEDNAVYLLPTETWHEIQKYCKQEDSHFPFSKNTFSRCSRTEVYLPPPRMGNLQSRRRFIEKTNEF